MGQNQEFYHDGDQSSKTVMSQLSTFSGKVIKNYLIIIK